MSRLPASQLDDRLWSEADSVPIVPFDFLEPRLKPLSVDGLSILDRELDLRRYPLRARVWVSGPADWTRILASDIEELGLSTNRHPDRMTVLAMTGVTALTRGMDLRIERNGDPAWPARQLADLLSAADLTHTSNEVSFMPGCQARYSEYMDIVFHSLFSCLCRSLEQWTNIYIEADIRISC